MNVKAFSRNHQYQLINVILRVVKGMCRIMNLTSSADTKYRICITNISEDEPQRRNSDYICQTILKMSSQFAYEMIF